MKPNIVATHWFDQYTATRASPSKVASGQRATHMLVIEPVSNNLLSAAGNQNTTGVLSLSFVINKDHRSLLWPNCICTITMMHCHH